MNRPQQRRSTMPEVEGGAASAQQPSQQSAQRARVDRSRLAKSLFSTIPIVLVGTMAMSLNLTGPISSADAQPRRIKDKPSPSELGKTIREALAAAHAASTAEAISGATASVAAAPATYTVAAGDTVSGIAARYGIATASVLALNGLSWKSVIYPGQSLTLSSTTATPIAATPVASTGTSRYTIVSGDTVSAIAAKFGVSTRSILSANGLSATSVIYAGSTLAIPASGPAAAAAPIDIVPTVSVTPNASVGQTKHVIKPGETIASIAKSYGQSIQAVLTTNGLGWSSIIYSGRVLMIPGVTLAAPTAAGVTPLTQEMAQNATTIISVGRSLGVGDQGLVIALATAMQESSLRNLNHGDRDSLGLFQQRPSQGWGSPAQVRDATYASRLFFGGPSGPNRGVTPGLLDISGWQGKSVTQAAQAVQRSAYPDAYARWETSARAWLAQLG